MSALLSAAQSLTPPIRTHGQCFVHTNQMLGQRVVVGGTPSGPPWFEEHGYRSQEGVEHVHWEMVRWMDTYVKAEQ